MDRRDFLIAWIQLLLLTLFPWLRSERGLVAAEEMAESLVANGVTQTDLLVIGLGMHIFPFFSTPVFPSGMRITRVCGVTSTTQTMKRFLFTSAPVAEVPAPARRVLGATAWRRDARRGW